MLLRQLSISIVAVIVFTVITGIIYPLIVTGAAQLLFPHQANGSLIRSNGAVVGSELIGQQFVNPKYFWGRLSATSPFAYNAASSSGTNYGPANPALSDAVGKRVADLRSADPGNGLPVPADLATSSASGLDPHISVAAARYQLARVARLRGISEDSLRGLVDRYTTGRQFGLLGEPTVNVLRLNLALDGYQTTPEEKE